MDIPIPLNRREEIPYQHSQSRQSYRVPCSLLIWYRLVSEEARPETLPAWEDDGKNAVNFNRGNIWAGEADPFQGISQLTKLFLLPGGASVLGDSGVDIPTIRTLRGEAINLSADGLLLKGEKSFHTGQALDLALYLPTSTPNSLLLTGEIVWTDPLETKKAGIRFIDLAEEYREQIIGFVFYQQRQIRRQQLLYQGN